MRSLTSKQKKLLDKWYKEQKENGRVLGFWWDVTEDIHFSGDLFQQIDDINPCELIYQNINNYIYQKVSTDGGFDL
jgi:hypothetical protein